MTNRTIAIISGDECTGKHSLATALSALDGWKYLNFERCFDPLIQAALDNRLPPIPIRDSDDDIEVDAYCDTILDVMTLTDCFNATIAPRQDSAHMAAHTRTLITHPEIAFCMAGRIEELVKELPAADKLLIVTRCGAGLSIGTPAPAGGVLYLTASLDQRAHRMMARHPEVHTDPDSFMECRKDLEQRAWLDKRQASRYGLKSIYFGYQDYMIALETTDVSLSTLASHTRLAFNSVFQACEKANDYSDEQSNDTKPKTNVIPFRRPVLT